MTKATRKPNLFIVGAPKSGTTSMYHYLKAHNDIFMSPVKEPHYFSQDIPYCFHIYNEEEEYIKLFAEAGDEKYVGESSVTYLNSDEACGKMHSFNPDAKIIIMLRHPIEQIYAQHFQAFFKGRSPESFKEALAEQKPEDKLNYISIINRLPKQIKKFQKTFGEENVHIIIFDEMKKDTAGEYKKTLQFLELDDSFVPEFKVYNKTAGPRNPFVTKILTLPFVVKFGKFMYQNIPYANRFDIYKLNQKEYKRPPIEDDVLEILQTEFLPTVKELETITGKDLSKWYTYKNKEA